MRGFQPQKFADGGLVQGVKRALGMDEEHNARIAAYRAQAAQEKAQQQQAQQPAQPAAPAAVTDYAAMGAMKRREKAAGLADGGMVRGPGTGTSDDVPDEVPEGTYIMPADSTQAVGSEQLAAMGARGFQPGGEKVPVNLSNGEFKMPPEQVHAIGVQALDQMKAATHAPMRGFAPKAKPEEPRQFFANGGLVEDERKRQIGIFPNNSPDAGKNIYGATQATAGAGRGMSGFVADAFPNTTAAVQGAAQDAKDAYRTGGLPAAVGQSARVAAAPLLGLGEDVANSAARAIDPAAQALKTFVTGDATPIGQKPAPAAQPPAVNPAVQQAAAPAPAEPRGIPGFKTDVQRGGGNVPPIGPASAGDASPGAKPGTPEASQVMSGVYRSGNSYSDTAQGAVDGATPRGLPSAQNMAAADALAGRQQQESMGRIEARGFAPGGAPQTVQAPQVLHSGNSWQARNDLRNAEVSASSIMNNGGRWDQHRRGDVSPERMRHAAMVQNDMKMREAEPAAALRASEANAKDATARYVSDNALSGNLAEVQARGFDAQARRAIDGRKLDLEQQVRGFDIRQGQRQEQLQARYEAAKTPEERAAVAQQIRDLSGKQAESPWKLQVTPTTKNADGSTSEGSIVRYNAQTGQVERVESGHGAGKSRPQFEKGAVYVDGQGRRARYTGGGWEPA